MQIQLFLYNYGIGFLLLAIKAPITTPRIIIAPIIIKKIGKIELKLNIPVTAR